MYKRIIDLSISQNETLFLWGARQTGKSTLLKSVFPNSVRYDLLLSDVYRRLTDKPSLIREECEAVGLTGQTQTTPVIVDEVQKIPELLDEVHWLIENRGIRFVLCGSSARKLKRGHGNLLGGRAVRRELFSLVYPEVKDLILDKALSGGLLPRHYTSEAPEELLRSYVGDYLKEEIAAEALSRNIPSFSRFLEIAALSNGEILNYLNISRECGVSAPTAKGYFQILEDTLMGRFLPAWTKRRKRRLIGAPKFYFADVGIVGELAHRKKVEQGSELFGRALEHYIFMEITAHASYSGKYYPSAYWRTASQLEVDFILGDAETAVEVKSTTCAQSHHARGLRAFKEEHSARHYVLVTLDPKPRTVEGIEVLPWRVFLERLWGDEWVKG